MKTKQVIRDNFEVGVCTNKDSSLVLTHPRNNHLTMLLLAGDDHNDLGVDLLMHDLGNWFIKTPCIKTNNPMILEGEALAQLKRINYRLYNNFETSFVMAIIGKQMTSVINMGNFRSYFINDKGIYLLSSDTEQTLGSVNSERDRFDMPFDTLDNTDYSSLLLTSTAITDTLSKNDMHSQIVPSPLTSASNIVRLSCEIDNHIGKPKVLTKTAFVYKAK